MRLPIALALLVTACGGIVEPAPAPADASADAAPPAVAAGARQPPPVVQITRAVYLDPSCESSPAGVAVPPVDVVVTLEHRRDLVVRAFDGASPSTSTRHYVRDAHVDGGCASRETAAAERLYDQELR